MPPPRAGALAIGRVGRFVAAEASETRCHRGTIFLSWLPWLDREFGWSDETAKFMRAHEIVGNKFQQDWKLYDQRCGARLSCAPGDVADAR
jgi:hypothetical protein